MITTNSAHRRVCRKPYMSQTHLSLHYHLVFHTKGNKPLIAPEWRERLHAFLGGCINTAGGIAIAIGGIEDHVHVFTGLKATHRLADVVKDIKVGSSKWVHTEIGDRKFGWQKKDTALLRLARRSLNASVSTCLIRKRIIKDVRPKTSMSNS